nr:cation:proton antiporter [Chloroflexota bacterium]
MLSSRSRLSLASLRSRMPYPVMVGLLVIAGIALFVLSVEYRTPNLPEAEFGQLLAAVALIIIAGRLLGEVVARLGQPRVMGEVLGGILLGPSLIGSLPEWFPGLTGLLCGLPACPADWPLSTHLQTEIRAAAEIGLVFYMFLIGLELDPQVLRGRLRQAVAISLSSIALPFTLGIGAAVLLIERFPELGDTDRPVAFAIFIGVSMSITAFPVLARILIERRMLRGPIGALALACAAIDDVAAWALLAVASALAVSAAAMVGQTAAAPGAVVPAPMVLPPDPLVILILALAFVLVMGLIARPVLARVADAYDEAGNVPAGWVVAIFLAVLGAAFLSQRVGIAAIFGAFVMGLIMPRHTGLTSDISRRIENFVVVVLLPLFFVVAGLRADIGPLFEKPALWPITIMLIAIAIVGKWVGAMFGARITGSGWRASAAIGALMNTRGLTELIVLYAGLNLGVISQDLFTMLVLMALVTTFMAGPALRIIDPQGRLSRTPEEEVRGAEPPPVMTPRPVPARAILVACQDPKNLHGLTSLAEALASAGEPREVILVQLVQPSRLTTRFGTQQRALTEATEELRARVAAIVERGLAARGVALSSARLGEDLTSLARDERIDLVLTDGRHSIARPGQP